MCTTFFSPVKSSYSCLFQIMTHLIDLLATFLEYISHQIHSLIHLIYVEKLQVHQIYGQVYIIISPLYWANLSLYA